MNKRIFLYLLPLLGIVLSLLHTGCKSRADEPVTPKRAENEKFFHSFEGKSDYRKLLFANEDYPIYHKVLKEAPAENKGLKPLQNSKVSVLYSGKLMSGEYFDKSLDKPVTFDLYNRHTGNGVIKGFRIALQNMDVGDSWEVVIPWQLGYGAYPQGYLIPAYSTLIFTVELVEIVQK